MSTKTRIAERGLRHRGDRRDGRRAAVVERDVLSALASGTLANPNQPAEDIGLHRHAISPSP